MKKKEFLTEAKRKAIITEKEKVIIESFAKIFNRIKRIDENEISENSGVSYRFHYDGIVKDNKIVYDTIQKVKDKYGGGGGGIGFGRDGELIISFPSPLTDEQLNGIKQKYNSSLEKVTDDLNQVNEFEEENSLYSREQQNKDAYQDNSDLNSEINFDRIFDELFSMKPEYEYDESSSGRLSRSYGDRHTSNGDTIATFNSHELSIQLNIYYSNNWEEDPDGPSYWGKLQMSYEHWADFGDKKLDDLLVKFGITELIKDSDGSGGISVEEVKSNKMINTEFMKLLSDKTQKKLYNQIQSLIDKNANYQRFDDY